MVSLRTETLSLVNDKVHLPQYNRSKISIGIFHIGVGGFHRAHQALAIDKLLSDGLANEWGICGVGLLQFDAKMRDVMRDQNCLYTLAEKKANGEQNLRVIGSIVDYIFAPDNVELVIERIATEAKIVSLTITEGGYNTDPATGDFDLNVVKEDIENPKRSKSVFGIVIEALRRRKERGLGGFTIMSCDNLQENGVIAKKSFVSFAKAVDESLADWIQDNVSFPNSMVDRITPVTSIEDQKQVSQRLGVNDAWPVVCEPFIQWVLEDKFVAGRPPFEKSLVQLVPDVAPYELMKLRLINAGHQAIAYFGLLMGYVYVHDVTQDKRVVEFLKAYMNREATSTLKPLPGIDIGKYKETIVERFLNPHVHDTLSRLAVDGSDRIPKFVLPVIQDRLKSGQSIWLSTAIVASFARYLDSVDENGQNIKIVDRMDEKLSIWSQRLKIDSGAIREEKEIFGEITENERFVKTFKEIYDKLGKCGSKETLDWLLSKE